MRCHNARVIGIILVFSALAVDFDLNGTSQNTHRVDEKVEISTQRYLDSQRKYLGGGRLEYVAFTSQKDNETGETLNRYGVLYLNPKAQGTVLICHGYMCNKFDVAFMRRTLFADYNVMMFDFRAHGEHVDDEQCCTFGRDEALDVIGAVNYLKSREDLNHLPRIGYGFSMGAVAAIQAQAEDETLFHAMILDCPYDTSENVLRRGLRKLKFNIFGYDIELPFRRYLERFAFNSYVQSLVKALLKTVANMDATATKTVIYPVNPVDSIKKVQVPCLFIHCYNDDKVPVAAAEALYNNAPGYKRLWVTNGRRHFDSIFYNPEKYIYKVNRFIKQVLRNEIKDKEQAKARYEVIT